ncbi:SDR family NAD(P)-dependent oxidoreductase [Paraburkholderia sp. XV]|uniref:SDR family NAD(P)-dependent oxidoreductase n=1 Tax=Paraburkholderia sp. XV TaxID=2831520 RepID=UPI00296EB6CA|nr:SDR family NAD(P)-dependent oxidoreductase [Paraburkholderia sp. XV]
MKEQVIVVTGATSGIGLTTAREAAKRGARVMLVGRDEAALKYVRDDLIQTGAQADYAVADVREASSCKRPRIARLSGSAASIRGSTMQAAQSTAVKGFTDALRLELMDADAPVSVTLIKPAGIHTLFVQHARNHMDVEPRLPPPLYAPEIVADAILYAAATPKRDIYVGSASAGTVGLARSAPGILDRFMGRLGVRMQRTDRPAHHDGGHCLELLRRSPHKRIVRESSLYTSASLHPGRTAALALGAAMLGVLAWKRRH